MRKVVLLLIAFCGLVSCAAKESPYQPGEAWDRKVREGWVPRYEGEVVPITEWETVAYGEFSGRTTYGYLGVGDVKAGLSFAVFRRRTRKADGKILWEAALIGRHARGRTQKFDEPFFETRVVTDQKGEIEKADIESPYMEKMGMSKRGECPIKFSGLPKKSMGEAGVIRNERIKTGSVLYSKDFNEMAKGWCPAARDDFSLDMVVRGFGLWDQRQVIVVGGKKRVEPGADCGDKVIDITGYALLDRKSLVMLKSEILFLLADKEHSGGTLIFAVTELD